MADTLSDVADAAQRVRKAAHALGCHDDEPFGAFTTAMAELLTAFEKKLTETKGLPLDKIESMMRKATTSGMGEAVKAFKRSRDWRAYAAIGAAVAVAVCIGAGMGYSAGWEARDGDATAAAAQLQPAFASGVSGGVWLADVAKNNDAASLDRQCTASSYQSSGGVACTVHLWRRQPEAPR